MSYVAEPYVQFVDDLLVALTGGVTRERFVFLPEQAPFRLAPPGPLLAGTVQVYGQAQSAFARFLPDRDYLLSADGTITFRARDDGTPAADATWPDPGTPFFVNYDHRGPQGAQPVLSDRNTGSVTRLMAESFAREYAVVSKQLESVYQAGFLDTSTGRDLDQLVALVGLERRTRGFAIGTVVFGRSTPAPADVFIPAGTRVSTAEPPSVVFETNADTTLHRGSLTVEAEVRAIAGGPEGVVAARAISVVHRPILGIEGAYNAIATRLGSADETDEELRARARRAHERSGRATASAMLAALTTLPDLREKDILVDDDPLRHPGVVTITIAAELSPEDCARAMTLIEESRPAGVRVLHNLDCPTPLDVRNPPGENPVFDPPDSGEPDPNNAFGTIYYPVAIAAVLLPTSAQLSATDRAALARQGEDAARAVVADAGVGETLVFNKLVAALMGVEGVLDVTLEMYPQSKALVLDWPRHANVSPGRTLRTTVDVRQGGGLVVEVGGQLVALDISVKVLLTGVGGTGDTRADLEGARLDVAAQLRDKVVAIRDQTINVANLKELILPTSSYTIGADPHYKVEFIADGVRVNEDDKVVVLEAVQRPWIRSVKLTEDSA